MKFAEEQQLLKIELDKTALTYIQDEFEDGTESRPAVIEYGLVAPCTSNNERRQLISEEIIEIDKKLDEINLKVEELNSEIDSLTNHADGIDYTIAVASGLLTGLLDSFFGEDIKKITDKQVNKQVIKGAKDEKIKKSIAKAREQAKAKGVELSEEQIESIKKSVERQFTPNDSSDEESTRILSKAIRYLENNKESPTDKIWNYTGSTITPESHHLDDLSHHASIVGLVASILTQFTKKCYFSDRHGKGLPIDIDKEKGDLIGKTVPAKLTCGVVNWFWHLMSDVAGTNKNPGAGMGIPGPLMSLIKEASSLPLLNKAGLPEVANKIFEEAKFDFRKEIAQSIPVLLNDIVVRLAFFIRRFITEIKGKKSLQEINWKNTLPFKNRTVIRMLTIATGTFEVVDIADAVIRSGGFNAGCIVHINFVGIGRFAVAVGTDVAMGIKKSAKENQRIQLQNEKIVLLNAKVFYKDAEVWIAAENTEVAISEAIGAMEQAVGEFSEYWSDIEQGSDARRAGVAYIREKDKEFANELADLLEWGV